MEAVVKSLDPNSTSGRESILDTATQILGEVVKAYVLRMSSTPLPRMATDDATMMCSEQISLRRFPYAKPASRRRDQRGCRHHVRPQDRHAPLRARGPQAPSDRVQLFSRRAQAGDYVVGRERRDGLEGRHELHELLLPWRTPAPRSLRL